MFVSGSASAQWWDLVDHNGFEACWIHAVTKAEFLAAMGTAVGIDGGTLCTGPIVGSGSGFDYTACGTPACPNDAIGCAITIHSPGFTGDFSTGAFSASGTADDITVPVTYSYSGAGGGSCTITVSAIALTYKPNYIVIPDGNNGSYMADLQSSLALDNYSASSPDIFCSSLLSTSESFLIDSATTSANAQLVALLGAATKGDSVCPLTP